jgi:hypothetical protein
MEMECLSLLKHELLNWTLLVAHRIRMSYSRQNHGSGDRFGTGTSYCKCWYVLYVPGFEQEVAYFPWYDTDRIENDASNTSAIVAFVNFAAVKFLPRRCLAMTGGCTSKRSVTGRIYEARRWDRLRCHDMYDYIPSCINTGSVIKLIGGIHRLTDSMEFVKT